MVKKLRIAMLAPLAETVPPKAYGGIELVIANLAEELTLRGHEVTVFCAAGSKVKAKVYPVSPMPLRSIKVLSIPAVFQALALKDMAVMASKFDLIHNHIDYNAFILEMFVKPPMVTTFHGPLNTKEQKDLCQFYDKKVNYVSISKNQQSQLKEARWVGNVYNGIKIKRYRMAKKPTRDYLLFLNRISPEKGALEAIKISKKFGMKLKIAGKVDNVDLEYYEKKIKPHVDGKRVEMLGEVCCTKKYELLANAYATIYPDNWPEPFGLVMVESMASGTPVVATRVGSIPEIIEENKTGFLGDTIDELAAKLKKIPELDPRDCRKRVEENFTATIMADNYLKVYSQILK